MLPTACAASGTFALTSIVPQIQKKNRPITGSQKKGDTVF